MKDVSVVVSTYSVDRIDYVLACIKSLKKQVLLPREIILVLDLNEALVEFYSSRVPKDVKIVVSEGYGLSNARNASVRVAEGEIIAFIDDDAIADRNWLKNLVGNHADSHVVGVGGLIEPLWEKGRPSWFPEELDWIVGCSYKGLPEHKSVVRNPIGCNMSFLKDIFEKVGYFKTNIGRFGRKLMASEETEFSMRILRNIPESAIIHDPSAVVYHRVPRARASLKYLVRRSFYEGYSKALVSGSESDQLSTENRYLKHLVKIAIPLRLKRCFELHNLSQLLALLLSTLSVFLGYFYGKMTIHA